MTLEQFREELAEYYFDYEFLKKCLEYAVNFGVLTDLYEELELNKFENIDELLEIIPDKQEIARAVYFGNIQNWCDDYFFINSLGNIESENQYQYEQHYIDNKKEIMIEMVDFIDTEDFEEISNMDELFSYINSYFFKE